MALDGEATTQQTQQQHSVRGAVCDVRNVLQSQSQSQSQPQPQPPSAAGGGEPSSPPSVLSSTPPPTDPIASPSSPASGSSTPPPPRSSPLCEAFGECVCQSDAASDLARAEALDSSTSTALRRMRSTLHRAEARLAATEAANHRAAVTGPQTGRARRSHQMTETWVARQRRMLKGAKAEVDELEKQVEEGRRSRELAKQEGERESESGCGVM